MAALKRTPADAAFSDCIRERAGWRCEVCGTDYTGRTQGLHCSHYHGRGNWAVRFDPDNAEAACYGCHQKLEGSPHDFYLRWIGKLGDGAYQLLLERKNDINRGREARKTKGKGEIAKHFRLELQTMREAKERGEVEIDFTGFY